MNKVFQPRSTSISKRVLFHARHWSFKSGNIVSSFQLTKAREKCCRLCIPNLHLVLSKTRCAINLPQPSSWQVKIRKIESFKRSGNERKTEKLHFVKSFLVKQIKPLYRQNIKHANNLLHLLDVCKRLMHHISCKNLYVMRHCWNEEQL